MAQDQRGRLEAQQVEINRKMATWTMVVGVFTAILALVTVVTGIAIYWQSYIAYKASNDNREQLRAVLQFTSIQTFAGPSAESGEQIYGFVSTLQNFGATRTGRASGWQSISFYKGEIPPNNVDFSKPNIAVQTSDGIVGPNGTVLFTPVTLKLSDVDAAVKKEGIIILWGRFEYRDIYDQQAVHFVAFCQRLTPTPSKEGLMIFAPSPFQSDCNKSG